MAELAGTVAVTAAVYDTSRDVVVRKGRPDGDNPTTIIKFQNFNGDVAFYPMNGHWNSCGHLIAQPDIEPNETVHITATGSGYVEYQGVSTAAVDILKDRSKRRKASGGCEPFRLIVAYSNPPLGTNKIRARLTRDMNEPARNVWEGMDDCYAEEQVDTLGAFCIRAKNFSGEPHNAVVIFCIPSDDVDDIREQADTEGQVLHNTKSKDVVLKYLRLGKESDVAGPLQLFHEDAEVTINAPSSGFCRLFLSESKFSGTAAIRGFLESQMPYQKDTTRKEKLSEPAWSGNEVTVKVNFDMWKMLQWHCLEATFVLAENKIKHVTLAKI